MLKFLMITSFFCILTQGLSAGCLDTSDGCPLGCAYNYGFDKGCAQCQYSNANCSSTSNSGSQGVKAGKLPVRNAHHEGE